MTACVLGLCFLSREEVSLCLFHSLHSVGARSGSSCCRKQRCIRLANKGSGGGRSRVKMRYRETREAKRNRETERKQGPPPTQAVISSNPQLVFLASSTAPRILSLPDTESRRIASLLLPLSVACLPQRDPCSCFIDSHAITPLPHLPPSFLLCIPRLMGKDGLNALSHCVLCPGDKRRRLNHDSDQILAFLLPLTLTQRTSDTQAHARTQRRG